MHASTGSFLTLIFCWIAACACQEFTHMKQARFISGTFTVKWFSTSTDLTVEASAPTTGWIGLGFNSRNALPGTDLYLAWVDDTTNQKNSLDSRIDNYINNLGITIRKDAQSDDYQLMEGYPVQEGTVTTVRFKRKLSTCDLDGDMALTGSTIHLVMAFGPNDPRADVISQPGPQLLQLSNAQNSGFLITPVLLLEKTFSTASQALPNGTSTIPAILNNADLTNRQPGLFADSFLYNCRVQKLDLDAQKSIIGYSPRWEEATDRQVYRVRVFVCPAAWNNLAAFNIREGINFECRPSSDSVRSILTECREVIATAGAGSQMTLFPENTGYSLANSAYGGRFILTHVTVDTGISRSGQTGVLFHVVNRRVAQAVGEFAVTSQPGIQMVVSPNSESRVRTICDTQCTKNIPADGIQLYGISHHTRQFGTQVRTRLIRAGKEVAVISEDSAHTQFFEPVVTENLPLKVQSGDQILVECVYDARAMTNFNTRWLFGGWTSTDEECSAVFHYYPRIDDFVQCGSAPEPRSIFPIFEISDYEEQFGVTGNNSQYNVDPGRFRAEAQLQRADKCTVARVNGLSFDTRHVPFCGAETMDFIRPGDIKLAVPNVDPQCPNSPMKENFNFTWPAQCYKTVYADEIPEAEECTNNPASNVVASYAAFLTAFVSWFLFCNGRL